MKEILHGAVCLCESLGIVLEPCLRRYSRLYRPVRDQEFGICTI
jgi:hypothetical protein